MRGAQHAGEAQRDVGVLGGIGRGLLERDLLEADLGLAAADHVVVVDRRVIEVARRQRIEAVAEAAGVEHIGHQHGVVVRVQVDAAQREQLQLELEVLPDLEHARHPRAAASAPRARSSPESGPAPARRRTGRRHCRPCWWPSGT